jgi:hypothetical protein
MIKTTMELGHIEQAETPTTVLRTAQKQMAWGDGG